MKRERREVLRPAGAVSLYVDRVSRAVFLLIMLAVLIASVEASQVEINGPAGSGAFGTQAIVLPNGNIVVTDPKFSEAGRTNIGAVYLLDGATLSVISVLKGSTNNDQVGGGAIVVLKNGNFVVPSGIWDNGSIQDAGAVTLCSSVVGCDGFVSPANSLVGTSAGDLVGGIVPLPNGNYVVANSLWDNPSTTPVRTNVGAVTLCNGITGCTGTVNVTNSLIGAAPNDQVGNNGIFILVNGNFVVSSRNWGGSTFISAVTFCNGLIGCAGVVGPTNSLTGGAAGNPQQGSGVIPLANGNYVVIVPFYFGPNAIPGNSNPYGAVTFCDGALGCFGSVTTNASLVGSAHGDGVGFGGVVALPNGNYVVSSPRWDNPSPATMDVGAVTLCNGAAGCNGPVTATNSLTGSTAIDTVGSRQDPSLAGAMNPITVLADGNYVVASSNWDNGGITNIGAVTWCSASVGCTGPVTPANSLTGSTANDRIGDFSLAVGVTPLKNGNYVVHSPQWSQPSPIVARVGAVTLCRSSTNSCAGQAVSASNSLVGTKVGDVVGSKGTITGESCDGSIGYVVSSPFWDNGAVTDTGAATFCSGENGCTGQVGATNSLVGAKASDQVGSGGATALPNGSFVVSSPAWDNGAIVNVGAVSFCNTLACTGAINSSNSLIGTSAGDQVGNGNANLGPAVLSNGNYVVLSTNWDNGAIVDAGAVTWCSGAGGCTGTVSSSNSLVGSHASDQLSFANAGLVKLANGNYVVHSPNWDNGAIANAGALTFASGYSGVTGPVDTVNSVLGTTSNSGVFFSPSYDQTRNRLFVGRSGSNVVNVIFFESTAVADGNIADPAVWSGSVPNSLSNVVIPAGRTVTVDAGATIGNLSIASGGVLTLNADLKLAGNLDIGTVLDTGIHKLTLSCPSRVTGASPANYVIGNVEKIFCSTDQFDFPTGTLSGFSPVSVTPTAACLGSSGITARANDGSRTGMNPNQSAHRYWSLTETGSVTADLLFTYLDADVHGDEAAYGLYRWEGAASTLVPSTLNAAANTVAATGISDFSDWAIGDVGSSQLPQTITFNTLANATYGDADFELTATASSGLPVTYTAIGSCTVIGSTVHLTGAGSCTITASQPGNPGYEPAEPVVQSFEIAKGNYTVLWTSPSPITYGTPLNGTQLNAIVSGVPGGAPIGSVVYSPLAGAVPPAGSQTLTVLVAETADYNLAVTSVPLTVNKALLQVIADDQQKQYSDPLPALTYHVVGFVNGDNETSITGAANATTTATQFSAPGAYSIDLALGTLLAANYNFEFTGATLTVLHEDAREMYSGPLFITTPCASCSTTTVTLSAVIEDITAITEDPAFDPYAGDIQNATVTFVNRDTNTPIATVPVALVSSGDTTIGIATFEWTVNIGTIDSIDFTIGVVVSGYYESDSSADDVVVTVSKPLSPGFVTGGGYLKLSNSIGQLEGAVGSKCNFGFNVKNVKKNLQGRLNIILRSGGRVYQFKGNVMSTLGVNLANPEAKTAVFTGKANITDNTDPRNPISLGGNNPFRVELTDRGEPGRYDSIAITISDSGGVVLFASSWNGTRAIEQVIAGGNLVVH